MHRIIPLPRIIIVRLSLIPILLLMPAAAWGGPLPVEIDHGWVRAVPPSVTDSAAFMELKNNGDTPVRLTGGSTPIASMAMPMETTRKTVQGSEVLGMKGVDFIDIPAHGVQILKPGGDHLMLMNLSAHPHAGEMVSITLVFDPGHQSVTVRMPARVDAGQ